MPRSRLKLATLSAVAALMLPLAVSAIHLTLWSPPLPEGSEAAIDSALSEPLPELVTGQSGFARSASGRIWFEQREPEREPRGTVMLIMGIAANALVWPPELIEDLLAGGYRVIRYDHRGTGLSTSDRRHYTLVDMADDTRAILDALNIEQAHIVGLSMGGMIAQELALNDPERVASLSLLMTTGDSQDPELPPLSLSVGFDLTRTSLKYGIFPSERRRMRLQMAIHRLIAGEAWQGYDLHYVAQQVLYNLRERNGYNLTTAYRHLSAVRNSPPRLERLRELNLPTLAVHGELDPLIPIAHGRKLAETIPGAQGVWLEDLGHDVPSERASELTGALLTYFETADASRRAGSASSNNQAHGTHQ